MPKITDKAYILPIYTPLQFLQVLSSGRTKPVLVRCIATTEPTNKEDIVLKISGVEISNDAKCREIIASFIAKELDILVAEPVLVHINETSKIIFEGTEVFERIENALGFNFGNKWAGDGFNEFVKDITLSEDLLPQALWIFLFDVLILNADRRLEKQNLKTYKEEIIIFDHESAFGFVFDIFPNLYPWIIQEIDKKWITKHLFYGTLRKYYLADSADMKQMISSFIAKLRSLDAQFWEKVQRLVPQEWQQGHTQVTKIQQHISQIIDNLRDFETQINALFL